MKTIAVIFCVLALSLVAECERRGARGRNPEKKHHDSSSFRPTEPKSKGRRHDKSHSHSHSHELNCHKVGYKKDACRFTPLTDVELVAYAASSAPQNDSFDFTSLGSMTFLRDNEGGLVVLCQCFNRALNSYCALEFDNAVDTFIKAPHNSTAFNTNSNADGSFDTVTSLSSKIKCGKDGRYVVDGIPLSHITCYSATFNKNKCALPPTGDTANCVKS